MKKLLSIPILLFGAVLLGGYLVLPKYQEFKNLREEVVQRTVLIQQITKYFSNLRQISENLGEVTEPLKKVETALPSKVSLSALFNFFQKKSVENGLLLENISIAVEKAENQTYLNLTLSGSYSSLKGFLKSLEQSSRLIEVKNISLDQKGKEKFPKYNLLLGVHSY